MSRWPKLGLVAMRFIQMGYVLEGEADLWIGNQILTLPTGTLLIIPPGVPHSDGSLPHWERPKPESAFSRFNDQRSSMSTDRTPLPPLSFEDSAVTIRGRSFWGEAVAPSVAHTSRTTGDGWSLYILYRDHIVKRGPWSVHEVNLQTEEITAH
ncbi:MAG: hypothetical protein CO095_18995, partial [Armatimonadetes bacterium CG_4_9_14_3_um_filter_58_7]